MTFLLNFDDTFERFITKIYSLALKKSLNSKIVLQKLFSSYLFKTISRMIFFKFLIPNFNIEIQIIDQQAFRFRLFKKLLAYYGR